MQVATISDIGMRRPNNQDAHAEVLASDVPSWYERGHVFVVADGMGAHAAGELASKIAADTVPHVYAKHRELAPPEAILTALREANSQIHGRGEATAEFRIMGTTCSVLVLLPQGVLAAHVGDRRIYRLRGQRLQQLTFDHSLVWEMRAAGQLLGSGDISCAIPKNVITRSLGPHPTVQVDLEGPFPVEVNDVFLVCSDGLTGRVNDEELAAILAHLEPQEAARMLVDMANLRGGQDNITLTVLRVTGREISTRIAGAEPLTVGGEYPVERTVHPLIWVVMGVLVLVSLVMALLAQWMLALPAAIGAVIALAVGILQKFGPPRGKSPVTLSGGRRLGRGPYTRVDLRSDQDVLARFAEELHQWRDAATGKEGTTDWTAFDRWCGEATALARQKDWDSAYRRFAQAARFLIEHMRSERSVWTADP